MRDRDSMRTRLLFVHDRFGAFGGAESNILVTARELKQRGHAVGLLHGLGTGLGENSWQEVFESRFRFPVVRGKEAESIKTAVASFNPEAVYVHKTSELVLLEG